MLEHYIFVHAGEPACSSVRACSNVLALVVTGSWYPKLIRVKSLLTYLLEYSLFEKYVPSGMIFWESQDTHDDIVFVNVLDDDLVFSAETLAGGEPA